MRLVYFAWVRERVGVPEEEATLPAHVRTVGDLAAWLSSRGEGYAEAFGTGAVRAAADRQHARPDTSLDGVREVAFFPPMTGG